MNFALYTTIFPGIEKFFNSWEQSVLDQTDQNFDIYIGVDGLDKDECNKLINIIKPKKLFYNDRYGQKGRIRKKAISSIIDLYDGIVFLDSDDLVYPSRIEVLKKQLEDYDVVGCALNLINADGNDSGIQLNAQDLNLDSYIVSANLFGLSNTAYRSKVLKKCLDFPDNYDLIDWYLITTAWGLGSKITFDQQPRVQYRQYENNFTNVTGPFTYEMVMYATNLVDAHYNLLFKKLDKFHNSYRKKFLSRQNSFDLFKKNIVNNVENFNLYIDELNNIPGPYPWWSSVANPKLEHLWKE